MMIRRSYIYLSVLMLEIIETVNCHARHWMYSKSWIEDYRVEVEYGLPSQTVLTEFSMETHKIGVTYSEDELSFEKGRYNYRESSTVFSKMSNSSVHNKGDQYGGQLVSDFITVPKNTTHMLPNIRVDIVLVKKVPEDFVNFIGLLETPIDEEYSSFSSSLQKVRKNVSVSYEFVLCGNYQRNDMLSVGYMETRYDGDTTIDNSAIKDAVIIDSYLYMVVVKSLTVNGTSLANCEELNVRGAIFDNTVPGIYLPIAIYHKFIDTISTCANRYNIPEEMRIWERRSHACYNFPVNWEIIPAMTVAFFWNESEAFEVSYTGHSLVHRYYTQKSRKPTFCYIFTIRRGDQAHITFGRTAFEGIRLIFNRSKNAITFIQNDCCGPKIELKRSEDTENKMSLCLPNKLRSTISHSNMTWIWILLIVIAIAILICMLMMPRVMNRGNSSPPTVHIFIPHPDALPSGSSGQEK